MKTLLLLLLSAIACHSQTATTSPWQTRMIQSQLQGAVGLPELVANSGTRPSLPIGANGSRFELWGMKVVNGTIVAQTQLATTEVGIYLPVAQIQITTADPYAGFPRSRVDQPFTVSYTISGLITPTPGAFTPTAATRVRVEHHVDLYTLDSFDGTSIASTALLRTFEITTNGTHNYPFPVTTIIAPDIIRRAGRERFIVYALADGTTPQRVIASAQVIMLPVSSGSIVGIDLTRTHRALPTFNAQLWRSYPATSTWVEIYDGEFSPGTRGTQHPTTFETPGRIFSDTYTQLPFTTFPSETQPTGPGRKTIVLRASSPFAGESIAQGGRVLDYDTINVGHQITVNGLVTTME